MATAVELSVETREKTGTSDARRLRKRGLIPGNIYGHGQEAVPLAAKEDQLSPIVHSGSHVVDLHLGGTTELAILREVQWDPFGQRILHFDLVRVDRDEKVEVEVAIELKGIAPGVVAGGILDHHKHSISIACPAYSIPDHVYVKINTLEIGQAIYVRDLDLPPEVQVLDDADDVLVQVNAVLEVEEAEAVGETGPVQPEVIGRKEKEEEEG